MRFAVGNPAREGKQTYPGELLSPSLCRGHAGGCGKATQREGAYLLGCGLPSPAPPCSFGREQNTHHRQAPAERPMLMTFSRIGMAWNSSYQVLGLQKALGSLLQNPFCRLAHPETAQLYLLPIKNPPQTTGGNITGTHKEVQPVHVLFPR